MIQLIDVTKVYSMGDQEVRALDGVNLTVEDGEFVAVIGASGSGKSTLLNVLGCLDTPTSGEYLIDGVRVSDLNDDDLAYIRNQAIGFVFQNYSLLPRTAALAQVELPLVYRGMHRGQREAAAAQALAAVGLADRSDHEPTQMSGGEQQRVAIARALVTNPSLILADEPTGNLDSRTSLEIVAILQTLNHQRGLTVVYVTHEPDIAAHAQRVIQMRDGRIVLDQRTPVPRWAPAELAQIAPAAPALASAGARVVDAA